jgi:hypothetical protein
MKTRIIQNEPEEPATREAIVGAPDGLPRHSRFGARMGRWSATHKKTAIFRLARLGRRGV